MTASARRHIDGSVTIRTPYNRVLVDEFKTIPAAYREWDQASKTWTFHQPHDGDALRLARRYYPGLVVHDPRKPTSTSSSTSTSWAEAMFVTLPAHLHDPAYKALVKVLHPDIGGDPRAAQQLNDAHRNRRRSAS